MTRYIAFEIDCEKDFCGKCDFRPETADGLDPYCALYGQNLEESKDAHRCQECLDNEIRGSFYRESHFPPAQKFPLNPRKD
jgi:hypothetical protein